MGAIIVRAFNLLSYRSFFLRSFSPAQIAAGVSGAWIYRIYREFELLAGKSAPHDFIQLLTYNAMTFSNEIEKIDTVRAYHVGCRPHLKSNKRFLIDFRNFRAARTTSLRSTSLWMRAPRCGRHMISASNFRIQSKSFPTWSEHSSTLTMKRPIPR